MARRPALSTLRGSACVFAVLLAALAARPIHAQNWNGNLEGTVVDPTGAAVPGAAVQVRNVATALTRATQTDAEGFYSFPFLPVGSYGLEVSKAGFAPKRLGGLVLQVGQTARLPVMLELARAETVLRVDALPPLIQTASPALGDEIDNQRVNQLPLNGRQFSQLALVAAGAVPPYPNGATQQFNTAAQGLGFSVNGQRSERNNFSLDGVTLMEPFAYSLTVNPSLDAIREFRVVETSYSAEQGMTSGAQVNIASRSGSNRLVGRPTNTCATARSTPGTFSTTRGGPSRLSVRTSSAPAWAGRSSPTGLFSLRTTKASACDRA